jgi:hypothetical protein
MNVLFSPVFPDFPGRIRLLFHLTLSPIPLYQLVFARCLSPIKKETGQQDENIVDYVFI